MRATVGLLAALVTVLTGSAAAQDARSVLQAAAANMGATNLKTIQYSGSGWTAAVGQSFGLTDDWPRFEVPTYTKGNCLAGCRKQPR